MTNEALKAHIAEIRGLMEVALASKEKDLLGDLLSGIIDSSGHAKARPDDNIIGQLDAAAVDFEMDHPKISKALREVGDTLNKMGV